MKIPEHIRLKYNKLYREVAKYYNLDDKVIINHHRDRLDFIKIEEFGIPLSGLFAVAKHLEENLTYLAPFYKFFHYTDFCIKDSPVILLENINTSIEKMRKENLANKNLINEKIIKSHN